MSIPPIIIDVARKSWKWQWNRLMQGLGPADSSGNYQRVPSEAREALIPSQKDLLNRSKDDLPMLIIGRSCPWAHRTWLVYEIKELHNHLNLLQAKADHQGGRWLIEPSWMGCKSLLELYKLCEKKPNHRATVPVMIDPKPKEKVKPELLCNESLKLVEALNSWPSNKNSINLYPKELKEKIDTWSILLQSKVNDGVYKCGFARNQNSYNTASEELFNALSKVEKSLSQQGPWLCGDLLTLADIRLFPTLIRWEAVYAPLFKCNEKPLWLFPEICEWRRRFFNLSKVAETCNVNNWREDYFGALFPLNPSNIIPHGPQLKTIVEARSL